MGPILAPGLLSILPSQNSMWRLDWKAIDEEILLKFLPQDVLYVKGSSRRKDIYPLNPRPRTEALVRLDEFRLLPTAQRLELFLSSLLLDIGKVGAPRSANTSSPFYTKASSSLARRFLFEHFDLGGSQFLQNIRETTVLLVKYQSLPLRLPKLSSPRSILLRLSSNGELAPDYSFKAQCILSEACVRSMFPVDRDHHLSVIEESRELSRSIGCYDAPYPFRNGRELVLACSGMMPNPDAVIYDNSWGEVILLCALPSTGKDRYCKDRWPDFPVIVPDDIRKEKGFDPGKDVSTILGAAQDIAERYLRAHQSFVWNAPSLGHKMRSQLIEFFRDAGARVRIVFLEASWSEILRRNAARENPIPVRVLLNMLGRLDFPERSEGDDVEWVIYQDAPEDVVD